MKQLNKYGLNVSSQKLNEKIDVIYGSRYLGGKIQLRKHCLNDIAVRVNTYLFNLLFDRIAQ